MPDPSTIPSLWTSVEIVTVVLQAAIFAVAAIGLSYTVRQIVLLRRSYADLHEWNRRKTAHEATAWAAQNVDDSLILAEKLNTLGTADPIPLETVKEACKDHNVRLALHRRLNFFESIAIGVRHSVLDAEIIKLAYESLFSRTLSQFKPYIEHIRNSGPRGSWSEFESITTEWQKQSQKKEPRSKTGS